MKRYVDITVASITAVLMVMFLFGVAASHSVPFMQNSVSLSFAVKSLSSVTLADLCRDRLFQFFPLAVVVTAVFILGRRQSVRVPAIVISFLSPMFWLCRSRFLVQFIALPFIAPSTTIGIFTGSHDGEVWSEGWIALAAMGWWTLMWFIVFFVELWRANKALENTVASRARFSA